MSSKKKKKEKGKKEKSVSEKSEKREKISNALEKLWNLPAFGNFRSFSDNMFHNGRSYRHVIMAE